MRTALELDKVVSDIEALETDYSTIFLSKVNKKVEKSGTCTAALKDLRELYKKMLKYMEFSR